MANIALIGHSHAVSILDGIGHWRQHARLDGKHEDVRYTRAFQGWFSVNTGGELFPVTTHPEFEALSGIRVCLITDATFAGELATIGTSETGQTDLAISDFLARFINQISPSDTMLSVLYGNEHAFLGLINHLPEYEFSPYLDASNAQPIDRRYIDAIVGELASRVVRPLACIRRSMQNARIVHVPPPPPLREPSKASVHELLKDAIERHGFVRPSLTQKWYTSYLDKLQAELTVLNIDFLDPHFEEACEDGFLRPEYAEGLTHGNAAYGRLVGLRIMQMLGL